MTILDEAMVIVRSIARMSNCEEVPDVRIVFATPEDQVRFKLELIKHIKPSDLVTAPIASRGGADCLEIKGVQVELGNKQRGYRAQLAEIIKEAEIAIANSRQRTITPDEIRALRLAATNLLTIVKG